MSRGRKPRTGANSNSDTAKKVRHEAFDSPCPLTETAQAEYARLVGVLAAKGTLDRVDLSVIAECSRIKGLLDGAHRLAEANPGRDEIKTVGLLTSQRRGLLRELGLTVQPSRSLVKANPIPDERLDPVASFIKMSG